MTNTRRKPRASRSFDDISRQVQEDVQDIVDYLNDRVVPDIRRESSKALRTASRKLADLAEYMEKHTPRS